MPQQLTDKWQATVSLDPQAVRDAFGPIPTDVDANPLGSRPCVTACNGISFAVARIRRKTREFET